MSHLVPHERFFKKQTTFFCCFPLTKELSKFLKRIVLGNRHFGTLSLNALIIEGSINNDGLCIGARLWPQKVNSQMARVKLSSVLLFFTESDHRSCAGIHRSHCRIVFYG